MALIVRVFINDRCIIDTHAVRIKGQPGEMCTYRTDSGEVIKHHYDNGGAALAIKLLKPIDAACKKYKRANKDEQT